MKIAVTGGTGSWDRGVGPVVIAALEAAGHTVTNLDRAVPGGIERSGFIKVAPLEEMDVLITDTDFPAGARTAIERLGIRLILAE